MTHRMTRASWRVMMLAGSSAVLLAACDAPLDFDLRGLNGGFSTADAARNALADRPKPDNRGVISYPNYQVAVARRNDTLRDVATRVGMDSGELARFNGVDPDVALRKGEVIALPRRVAEPSPATGASTTGPILPAPVDIDTLAEDAISRAPETPSVETAALPAATPTVPKGQTGIEPVRHKVERGETAFTVARLYDVPVKALADWNGLGSDLAVREGQYLLIPVPDQSAPKRTTKPAETVTQPGTGTQTPKPPSSTKPLPKDEPVAAKVEPDAPAAKPVANVGKPSKPQKAGKLLQPVKGTIIREYAKGRNEGINIKAAPGTPVKAADAGTVAAITESSDGVPIVVLRHGGNLLTVYANVTGVTVKKGDKVTRGQAIAKLRDGKDAYVHFEVREGFDSTDPQPFLN